MAEVLFKLFLVLLLVIANGFFVAVEFALVSVRRSRIESLAANGKMGARSVLRALDHLDSMLSASQFGITIASLALGAVGESTLAHLLEPVFARVMPVNAAPWIAHSIAVAIALAVITYLHLVLGEYAPKAFAIEKAEAIAMATARSMEIFYKTFKPFIWFINVSGIKFLKLFGVNFRPGHHAAYTEDEIRYLIKTSHESGHLQSEEKDMIYNVFEFSELTARQVMIPRTEVTALEDTATFEEVVQKFQSTGYSRLPVYHDSLDEIVGILHGKDVMSFLLNKKLVNGFEMAKTLRPPVFIPDTMKLADVLQQMKRDRTHLAVVIDEHSGVEGILTLEDLLEELVGEIQDEHDDAQAEQLKQQSDGNFTMDGSLPIHEANRKYDLNLPEASDYTTVAGFLLWRAGRMLAANDVVEYENLRFTIESVVRRRITRVKMERVLPEVPDDSLLTIVDL
ncbi:MAG: HlyC/CorC family transporter [Acidobacteria bacterium]|nr:HlyC/CorC family transporter [Acidobacteriota bacterium]